MLSTVTCSHYVTQWSMQEVCNDLAQAFVAVERESQFSDLQSLQPHANNMIGIEALRILRTCNFVLYNHDLYPVTGADPGGVHRVASHPLALCHILLVLVLTQATKWLQIQSQRMQISGGGVCPPDPRLVGFTTLITQPPQR